MKSYIIYIALLLITFSNATVLAQSTTPFTTAGNKIVDPCGNQFIPRGVNYSLLDDWNFPGNLNNGTELSYQIEQANPNIVRIQWYINYGQSQRPAYALSDLDSVISRFDRNNIVSLLEIHDFTCSVDYTGFTNTVTAWWASAPVVALITKHQNHMMINLANEFGQIDWTNDPATAYNDWVNTYSNAITTIRAAGVIVPIMIDAPDCGSNLQRAINIGSILNTTDPLKRIIMSAHAYWYTYSATDMQNAAQSIANAAIPVVLGEIANVQDASSACSNTIPSYTDLLQACQTDNIGWMAWTWTNDQCPDRQLSVTGEYADLSPYGTTVINNPNYGLLTHASKACFSGTGITNVATAPSPALSPNPAKDVVNVLYPQTTASTTIRLTDIAGKTLGTWDAATLQHTTGGVQLHLPSGTAAGLYFINITNTTGSNTLKLVVE